MVCGEGAWGSRGSRGLGWIDTSFIVGGVLEDYCLLGKKEPGRCNCRFEFDVEKETWFVKRHDELLKKGIYIYCPLCILRSSWAWRALCLQFSKYNNFAIRRMWRRD